MNKFISIENAIEYNRRRFNGMNHDEQVAYLAKINVSKTYYNLENVDGTFYRVSKKEYLASSATETQQRNYYRKL